MIRCSGPNYNHIISFFTSANGYKPRKYLCYFYIQKFALQKVKMYKYGKVQKIKIENFAITLKLIDVDIGVLYNDFQGERTPTYLANNKKQGNFIDDKTKNM